MTTILPHRYHQPVPHRNQQRGSARSIHIHGSTFFDTPVNETVQISNDAVLRSSKGKSAHWSIAWSDLMMTMFILFLCLFVYQAAHREFLQDRRTEIVGGDTRKAREIVKNEGAALPFEIIKSSPPLITAGTVKKIEPVSLQDVDLDTIFPPQRQELLIADRRAPSPKLLPRSPSLPRVFRKNSAPPVEPAVIEPFPISIDDSWQEEVVGALNRSSGEAVAGFSLGDIAKVDLVPDKAVRIILTGDLLFDTGHAALSLQAIHSLERIAAAIKDTGYQIHVEGHTDNIPITSGTYSNNWELSLARANAVAVFLIEDMKMNPQNIVISGYSSYRPVAPNTSAENRARNRRVEIVISKTPETEFPLAYSPSHSHLAMP